MRRSSVTTRLALAALAVSLTSLLITAAVGIIGVQASANDVQQGRLPSLRSAKAAEIESFFRFEVAQVGQMARSEMFVAGVQAFAEAFDELAEEITPSQAAEQLDRVTQYYLEEFFPALEGIRGEGVPPLAFLPATAAAMALQDEYIASNPRELGQKDLYSDAGDGSAWTEVHAELHPIIRSIVDRRGLVDLFLIEPATDTIVYSTAKEPDFATSLAGGPQSGTPLARLVEDVVRDAEPGEVLVSDFSIYPPSLDAPASFLAAPLFEGDDDLVGVLAVQIDTAEINQIMSSNWRNGDLGDTGEVYLVGADRRMRSDSRAFVENREAYLARIDEVGEIERSDRDRIEAQGTTILFQPVDNDAVDAAFAIDDGLISNTSYLGADVFTAYEPLDVPGLDWVILSEAQRSEITEPVDDYRTDALILTAAFVAGLTFIAVVWASAFVGPVRTISGALRGARRSVDLDTIIPARGAREFRELAEGVNQMFANLRAHDAELREMTDKKRSLLRRLLPSAVARAVDSGDRTLLETVPQATVAVLVLNGLGDVVARGSLEEGQELLHDVIDELDGLADVHGLERVKVLGDTYYAACGLSTAHLDHIPRSVAFALQACDAVQSIGDRAGFPFAPSAGVHSGTVTVGLTGERRLVYDVWGETVSIAHRLARLASPGAIYVSETTKDRLSAHHRTRPTGTPVAGREAWVVDVAEPAEQRNSS